MSDKIIQNVEAEQQKQDGMLLQEQEKKEQMEKDWYVTRSMPVYDNWKMVWLTNVVEKKYITQDIKKMEDAISNKKIDLQYKLITEWLSEDEKEMLQLLW